MLNKEQLTTIIKLQTKLDQKIAATRSIDDNQEILNAKFLALMIEISEFANEQRCFKYWSSKPASEKKILLEEYIDGLHFIISIIISMSNSTNDYRLKIIDLEIVYQDYSNLTLAFLDLFAATLRLQQEKNLSAINQWFNIYYTIAKQCNFTNHDIFNAYLAKNKINHLRQEQNY